MTHLFTLVLRDPERRAQYVRWHFRFDGSPEMNWYFTQGMN